MEYPAPLRFSTITLCFHISDSCCATARPGVVGRAGRTTPPPLVALAPGTHVKLQHDADVVRQQRDLDAAAQAGQGQCVHGRHFGTAGGAVADRRVIGDGDDETLRHGSGESRYLDAVMGLL
jgi:hypothetical protein